MRVLHAVHAYPPSLGGSEAVVHRLSQGLLDRGHEVEVATGAHPERGDQVDGVPVTGFQKGPAGWRAYRRFVHHGLSEDRWDVVMTYHSKVWTHLALFPFDKVANRWVYAPTEFTDLESKAPRHLVYYRTVEPRSLRKAARVMVLTEQAAAHAVELAGAPVEDHLRVIPNGVDHGFWAQDGRGGVRQRFELPEEVPLVLFVGGLWPHKQVETLVDALPLLDGHHLVVAGPRRDREATVLAHAARRGMADRVHLLGKVDREDLRDLYHACTAHASASDNEGFGLTFLEAMAAGAPVVARPVGVVPELVEAGAGVHVAETPAGFAEAIETATARGGKGNREIAARYDWEQVIDRLVACYEEVNR